MPVDRYIITDHQWAKIEPHCKGKKVGPWADGGRWAAVSGGGLLDRPDGGAVARPARRVRQVELGLPAVPGLGNGRCFGT